MGTNRQTGRRTNLTKPKVAFRNLANAPKNRTTLELVGPTQLIFVDVATHRTESTPRRMGCFISLLSQHPNCWRKSRSFSKLSRYLHHTSGSQAKRKHTNLYCSFLQQIIYLYSTSELNYEDEVISRSQFLSNWGDVEYLDNLLLLSVMIPRIAFSQ